MKPEVKGSDNGNIYRICYQMVRYRIGKTTTKHIKPKSLIKGEAIRIHTK